MQKTLKELSLAYAKVTGMAGFCACLVMVSAIPQSMAADWTITQSATITVAAPALNQGATATVTGGTQAINGIALQDDADNLVSGSQLSTLVSSTSLELTQGPLVDASTQAFNVISARNIGAATGSESLVRQTVSSQSGVTTLSQSSTAGGGGGGGNLQAANAAVATAAIHSLRQEITESGTLTVSQTMATDANTQAVNFAKSGSGAIGVSADHEVQQGLIQNEITTLSQTNSGVGNIQGGNVLKSAVGGIKHAAQIALVSAAVTMNQTNGGDGNVQAVNLAQVAGGDIVTLRQTTTFSGAAVVDINTSNSSGDNVQAINLVQSSGDGDIGSGSEELLQSFITSAATSFRFDQVDGTGDGNVQAGNMAAVDGTSAVIAGISQRFTGSTTDNTFTQTANTTGRIQAGNLIDLGTGSMSDAAGPHQTFIVTGGGLAMVQQNGTNSLQALNAIVDAPGGTAPVNVEQSLSIAALTFTMKQDGGSGNGQYGNFAGAKL